MRLWAVAILATLITASCDGIERETQTAEAPTLAVADTTPTSAMSPDTSEGGYRWHTAQPGESVQYGIPDTDDRLLRIDCSEGGRITIGGPAGVNGLVGAPVTASFGEGAAVRSLPGVLGEAGDGMNFFIDVEPDDPALLTLLAGRSLKVSQGEYSWEVPAEGAAAELKPIIQACLASAP